MGTGALPQTEGRPGILTALPAEARSLGQHLAVPGMVKVGARACFVLSGSGAERARQALLALHGQGLHHVINWGVAGALRTDLRAGDLCIPIEATDGDSLLSLDGNWRQGLCAHLQSRGQSLRAGRLYSSPQMLSTAEQRLTAARTAGADAVDMEGYSLAQTARSLGMQLLLVKVIVDEWDVELPDCVVHHTDAMGRPMWRGFVPSLLGRPGDWQRLWRVGLAFRHALRRMRVLGGMLSEENFCLPE